MLEKKSPNSSMGYEPFFPVKKDDDFLVRILYSFLNFLWPIARSESFKCLTLILIHVFVTFNYTILKSLKDPLITTLQGSGGAVFLSYAKTWAVLPAAVFAAIVFTRLCNRFGFRRTFNIFLGFFTVYLALFVFILYPFQEMFYIGGDSFIDIDPSSFGFFSFLAPLVQRISVLIHFWPVTSFYVISELWSSIALAVLFWGFANHITRFHEAKRFYGLVNLFGNLSGVCAAFFALKFNEYSRELFTDLTLAWNLTMYGLGLVLTVSCCGILVLFNLTYRKYAPKHTEGQSVLKKKRKKLGFLETFSKASESKYVLSIALIVLAYNLSMNILEILWKDQALVLYPNKVENHEFLTGVLFYASAVSFVISFFISFFIRLLGWTKAALVTPIVLAVLSCLFFYFFFFGTYHDSFLIAINPEFSSLYVLVMIGALQNVLCRSFKFSFFDATKEMSFIPLSKEQKMSAKAVIDGFGSRFGKAGGAVMTQILDPIFHSVSAMAGVFMCVLVPVVTSWFYSIFYIGKELHKTEPESDPEL